MTPDAFNGMIGEIQIKIDRNSQFNQGGNKYCLVYRMSNAGNLLLFSLGWVKALISKWQLQHIGVLHIW